MAVRINASINRFLRPGDSGGSGGRRREPGAPSDAAVVETVTVTEAAELPPTVAGFGETEQTTAPDGAPVQVKLTLSVKPPLTSHI
jgi:hypothetical protein